MNWLLLLHIATLVFWVGFLLYLPVLLAPTPLTVRDSSALTIERPELAHLLFTHVATPVANHILLGLLVIRAEAGRERFLRPGCLLSILATCALATAVLWVVLAKPELG